MKARFFRSRRGLTLVEVMIAALILVIGFVGILGLVRILSYQLYYSSNMTLATEMARSRMDALLGSAYPPVAGTQVSGIFSNSWTVADGPIPNTKTVVLQVVFTGPNGQTITNVVMQSLVRDPAIPPLDVPFASFPQNILQYE